MLHEVSHIHLLVVILQQFPTKDQTHPVLLLIVFPVSTHQLLGPVPLSLLISQFETLWTPFKDRYQLLVHIVDVLLIPLLVHIPVILPGSLQETPQAVHLGLANILQLPLLAILDRYLVYLLGILLLFLRITRLETALRATLQARVLLHFHPVILPQGDHLVAV